MANVLYEVKDHIATVTLDRHPVNAWTADMENEFMGTFDTINNDLDVKVVILTGAGRGFSAGDDVNNFGLHTREFLKLKQRHDTLFHRAYLDVRVPLIAAVHGFAIGMGACLVAGSDIIVATPETKIGMPELLVGTIGGPEVMDRLMHRKMSNYYSLTGENITAQEIWDRGGGIFKIVEKENLLDTAMEIAQSIAAIYGPSVEFTKRLIGAREDGLDYNNTVVLSRLSALTLVGDPGREEQLKNPYWKK